MSAHNHRRHHRKAKLGGAIAAVAVLGAGAATLAAGASASSTTGRAVAGTSAPAGSAATVASPYGLLPASEVVQVDDHQGLRVVDGRVKKVDLRTGTVLTDLGAAATDTTANDPYRHAAGLRSRTHVPAVQSSSTLGGHCPTDYNLQHIQSFSTTWTVPPKPKDSTSTTTYFIWNGLSGGALQPVLQWGNGSASYKIANWYYVGGKYAHGAYLNVSPGTKLTGRIDYLSHTNGTYNYRESFVGYPAANVTVHRTTPADGVIECFEPYTNGIASKNPNAPYVAMTDIRLTAQPGHTVPRTIAWSGNSSSGSTTVVSNSSSNGRLNLYFNGR